MINLDDELAQEYLVECLKHAVTIKADLQALKNSAPEIDDKLVNRMFRAARAIKSGGLFDLVVIRDLAQQMEEVLALIRSREMAPTAHRVMLLLHASQRLHELALNPRASNQADIAGIMGSLAGMCVDCRAFIDRSRASAAETLAPRRRLLHSLLAEDDRTSRLVLETFLTQYGECDLARNGKEAVEAFRTTLEQRRRYDLVCLDIMMPEMDGHEALKQIRALEEAAGIVSSAGTKIIMTSAVTDAEEVFRCLQESCDSYLVKPIDLTKLLAQMKSYQLV